MNKIDVYVQAGTAEEAKCFKIAEDATVGDLIQCVEAEGVAIGLLEEEIALLVEEKETLVKRAHKLSECGISGYDFALQVTVKSFTRNLGGVPQ
jgi:hypothetical protein